MALEVELKARLADPGAVRLSLQALGARLAEARTFEDNLLLDDPEGSRQLAGDTLRVRLVGGRALLTWKGAGDSPEASRAAADGLKVREEVETVCENGEALLAILGRLGLTPVFRYQKYRETWEFGEVQVVLDETPAGDFLEIEGPAEAVRSAQRRLQIPATDVVGESYPTLFRRLLEERGDSTGQMVFRAAR